MTAKQKFLVALIAGSLAACANVETAQKETPKTDGAQSGQSETSQVEVEIEKPTEPVKKPKPEVKPDPLKTADGKLILGEQEWVYFPGLEESFDARVDTGATTSSISAVDVEPFERDGKDWVKFKIGHDKVKSEEVMLPVERWVKIKQANSEEYVRRAVVLAWVQVGELKEKTPFTLADRSHLKFPVLLGRSFFTDVAIVDVSKKYVQPKKKN